MKRKTIVALAVAFCAASPARAAYWDWIGLSSGTSYFDDTSCWFNSGGGDFKASNHNFSTTRRLFASGWDYYVTFRAVSSLTGDLNIDYSGNPIFFVGENSANGITSSRDLKITSNAELDIESGSYSFRYVFAGAGVKMNGGELAATSDVFIGTNGNAVATINEGGKISAPNVSLGMKNGTGTVSLNGGELEGTAKMKIGVSKEGAVTIANGGKASSAEIQIGAGGAGTVAVDNGGELSGTYIHVGYSSAGDVTVNNGGKIAVVNNKYMSIGKSANGTVTINAGGVYENILGNGNTIMANGASTGTLNINGGGFTTKNQFVLNYTASAVKSVVNVTDGGVLATKQLYLANAGTNGGEVTLDGGTLRAYADSDSFVQAHANLHIYAGANGATIDSAAHSVSFAEDIENKTGEAGIVTFTGGGTITFNGTPLYTGGTTIDAGTVLAVPSATKTALAAIPLGVAIPSGGAADGTTVLEITDGGTFTAADVAAMSVTGADAGRYALYLDDGDTKVKIADTLAGEYVWNGGASGDSWKTAGAWTKNGVAGDWYDSTAAFFRSAGDSATVDSAVSAASVTFEADATVGGSAVLTVPSVSVAPSVSAAISAPTAGVLDKTGGGMLTLSQPRTAPTTLSGGTLVMTGAGATVDPAQLSFGADANPIALRFADGAGFADAVGDVPLGAAAGGTAGIYGARGFTVGGHLTLGAGQNQTFEYVHESGTLTVGARIQVNNTDGYSASTRFAVSGGKVELTSENHIILGYTGAAGSLAEMAVENDAQVEIGYSIIVGNATGASLTLADNAYLVTATRNAQGFLTMAYRDFHNGDQCYLNLSGGTLETRVIESGGYAPALVTFNGGTWKAQGASAQIKDSSGLTVIAGSNGGTIDANGSAVTVRPQITGAGGMAYRGGGSVTLAAVPAYTGGTTVEVGTTLLVPAAIAGADLTVTIPGGLKSGMYKVVASSGTAFSPDILSTAAIPSDNPNAHFSLSGDGKEIWCAYAASGDKVWIGGAGGSLNESSNWLPAGVPSGGNAIIGNSGAATLANPEGSVFAPAAITFPADTAPVTIGGEAISGILAITNNAAQHHVFNCPVVFADGETAFITMSEASYMDFAGGATMHDIDRSADGQRYKGKFTITTDSTDWQPGIDTVILSGTEFKLPNGTFWDHLKRVSVESGATVTVKNAKMSRGSTAYLFNRLDGTFAVTDDYSASGGDTSAFITHYTAYAYSSDATVIANRLRPITGGYPVMVNKTVVGAGGILCGAGAIRPPNSGTIWFGSGADWTMCRDSQGDNTGTDKFAFYKFSSADKTSTVTFDTTDYYDPTVARTITAEARIGAHNADSATNFVVNVTGIGTFVFANTNATGNIFSGGLNIRDSAKVVVKPGAVPGKGAVTVGGGATLDIPDDGAIVLGGALTLEDGATLKFKVDGSANSKLLVPSLVANGTVTVNVSVGESGLRLGMTYPILELASGGLTDISAFRLEGDAANLAMLDIDDGKLVLKANTGLTIRLAALDRDLTVLKGWLGELF